MKTTELIEILELLESENPDSDICIYKEGFFDDEEFAIAEMGGSICLIPAWQDDDSGE